VVADVTAERMLKKPSSRLSPLQTAVEGAEGWLGPDGWEGDDGDGWEGDDGEDGEGADGEGREGEEGEGPDGLEGAAAGMEKLMLPSSQRYQWSGSHPPDDGADLEESFLPLFFPPLRRMADLELPPPLSPPKPLAWPAAKNRSEAEAAEDDAPVRRPARESPLGDRASSRTRRFRRSWAFARC
jgi:hypothetical protein